MDHSRRMSNWNYGWRGNYFITINCSNKNRYFGRIESGEMIYSELGLIVKRVWKLAPKQFPFISIDEFQVMPDHFHAIVIINKSHEQNMWRVEKGEGGWAGAKSPMLYHNLSRVVNWFKGRCTYECRKINPLFKWQSTFDDRIIRDQKGFVKIRYYIRNNPLNWNPSKRA